MKEILLTFPFKTFHLEQFDSIDSCRFTFAENPTDEQLAKTEIIFGLPTIEQMKKAPELKWVQSSSAGVDKYVAHKNEFPEGVTLTCLSGAFGQSVSEYVLAMTLMFYKNLHLFRDNQNNCLWKDEGWQDTPCGKNLLILGAGNIGGQIAKLFRSFGCHITGLRRNSGEGLPDFDKIIGMDGLDKALGEADIIVGVLPDTDETRGLLSRERLALLKSNALFINAGRGNLVDTDALTECLQSNRIAGAALDVTDPEPLPADHPLWRCRNCIIAPHVSGGSFGHLKATEKRLFDICKENLRRYRANEPLMNVVDFSTGYRKSEERY